MTPFDEMPVEVRRANWGWFGPPWWSFVCYDDAGRLISEMRKPFPAGETCLLCGVLLDEAAGDSGQAVPCQTTDAMVIRHVHKECSLRSVTGPVTCLRGEHDHDSRETVRAEALAVWEWVSAHGMPAAPPQDGPVP